MILKYTLRYTLVKWGKPGKHKVEHKKYDFESENDLLAAADDGMCAIFDDYHKKYDEIIFRSIEHTNADQMYKDLAKQREVADAKLHEG